MSGRSSDTPTRSATVEGAGRLSLRRLARAWPRAIVVAWLAITVVMLARVVGDPGVEISGDPEGLLPLDQRASVGAPLLLLTIDDGALGQAQGGMDILLDAASRVTEVLGPRRIPLGPPVAELTAWNDAHALYLLPVFAHEALAERLQDHAMTEAVDDLRARLSSPLFGLAEQQPRRDPLRLQAMSRAHAGRMTTLGNAEDMPAELTAAGDLMALDGRALLMQLRTDAPPTPLANEVTAALEGLPVSAAVVGPGPRRVRGRQAIEQRTTRLLSVGFAGLILVLSLALRAIRPVLAIVAALGSALVGLVALGPALDPHTLPLLVLLMGFGCEGAMHLSRISARGWPAATVLGTALLPLWLSPYPVWQQAAIHWLVGVAVVVGLLRLVVPALLALLHFSPTPARRGFNLRPPRLVAALLSMAALASGLWAVEQLPRIDLDRTPRPTTVDAPERRVREDFFDPRLVVQAASRGDTPAASLESSAEDARQLAALVPADATRVDSPGRLVLPAAELQSRQRSLLALDLDTRMDALHEQLQVRGFRPDAFGEFLRSAADLDTLPTAQAALDGPLGPWINGYLDADGTTLLTRVHLRPDPASPIPRLEVQGGEPLALSGPAVAARRDRRGFADGLGIVVAAQLWLGALAVWLATRRLPMALGCACAALVAQTAVLGLMVPLGLGLGAASLPALLLIGAAAMIAGARACRSVAHQERFYATGVLLSGLCQAVAGLTLVASGDPLWRSVGLVVAVGSVVASGAGLFVAPGIMRILGGGRPRPSAPASAPEDST